MHRVLPLSRLVGFTFTGVALLLAACSVGQSAATIPDLGADASRPSDTVPPLPPADPTNDAGNEDGGPAIVPIDGSSPTDAGADAHDGNVTKDASTGAPDTGVVVQGNAGKYCASMCAFAARCAKPVSRCDNGGAQCIAGATTTASFWRAEFVDALQACYASAACTSGVDDCLGGSFVAVEPTWPNTTYVQDCLSVRSACGNPFADDYCLSLPALTDMARADAAACLDEPCANVRTCLSVAGAFAY